MVTTLLDKFKSDIPIITDDFKNFASSIGNITLNDISNGWVDYAKKINITDEELIKFLADVDSGKRNIEDIDSYISNAAKETSIFGKSLKSLGANLLTTGANMAI